jgi:hypothetical protein
LFLSPRAHLCPACLSPCALQEESTATAVIDFFLPSSSSAPADAELIARRNVLTRTISRTVTTLNQLSEAVSSMRLCGALGLGLGLGLGLHALGFGLGLGLR